MGDLVVMCNTITLQGPEPLKDHQGTLPPFPCSHDRVPSDAATMRTRINRQDAFGGTSSGSALHVMLFSILPCERCFYARGCEATIASEHYLDSTTQKVSQFLISLNIVSSNGYSDDDLRHASRLVLASGAYRPKFRDYYREANGPM